ncbi:unnamed protein product [Brassicogethes aeneus]|uniref:Uncharacterized protein n=1 Tax=Brassicogethes aeneus TaxID=1431903 RepID=A0A9P0BEA3_BRAAE|nr:unnamed protein product [Brassicogethes aeneus]
MYIFSIAFLAIEITASGSHNPAEGQTISSGILSDDIWAQLSLLKAGRIPAAEGTSARNAGVNIIPPVAGKATIIPATSAEGRTISGPAGSIYTGPLSSDILAQLGLSNTILSPAISGKSVIIPPRSGLVNIVPPVAGTATIIPARSAGVNILGPSENLVNLGWNNIPARAGGVNIIPSVTGQTRSAGVNIGAAGNIGGLANGGVNIIPPVAGNAQIIPPRSAGVNIIGSAGNGWGLTTGGVNIVPPVAGKVEIIPPRSLGVNIGGSAGHIGGLAGWQNIIPDDSWIMNELVGLRNIMGPATGGVRIIGPSIAGNNNGILDWSQNILGNDISKSIWTNGGGSISIGSHGAVISGPETPSRDLRGIAGRILGKRQARKRW